MCTNPKPSLDDGLLAALHALAGLRADELTLLCDDYAFRGELAALCDASTERAYGHGDRAALEEVHAALALIHDGEFRAPTLDEVDHERQTILRDVGARLERAVLGHELSRISEDSVTGHPTTGPEYVRWLKTVVSEHPAGWHPLYHRHLAESGSREDLRLLLAQETSLDPRFDDILAFMQIGRQGAEKLEIAANYWDEMGNGDPARVHSALFGQALDAVGADPSYIRDSFLLEAGISGNVSACLALSRRHYHKAVGYFGVTEYLAPRRFRCVVDAWRRHGLDEVGIVYHDLHIGVDAQHAAGWFKNVVHPLLRADPRAGREIALGAMIRLNTSADYLDALLGRMSAATPAAV
ncbi:iron-containing redox enzyme family protein [Streptomyces sp. NBC_01565]|uniref:iron-containing redox enzyme family protein n=1 Tax=Streptomyces sp. NBC_01565 TaxID=2975881 RepID=UPI0022547830|nr:iron-containing redox enzyme family protein [Streptomyces sp. NBC_01565]MCX4542445.1 iron-containing redox enzyme family protein [Streptomyces sp. NBC_01565]